MSPISLGKCSVAMLAFALSLVAPAAARAALEGQPHVSNTSLAAELQTLAAHAGTIFVGQITSIDQQPGVVVISFRVEQPVRGAAGPVFVLREWGGLWAPGANRYAPGARVLAFVNANSGVGLASPVHGQEGLVPVVVQGARSAALLDIRRIAASVLRTPETPLPTEADGAFLLPQVLATLRGQLPAAEWTRVALPGAGAAVLGHVPGALSVAHAPLFFVTANLPGGRSSEDGAQGGSDAHR